FGMTRGKVCIRKAMNEQYRNTAVGDGILRRCLRQVHAVAQPYVSKARPRSRTKQRFPQPRSGIELLTEPVVSCFLKGGERALGNDRTKAGLSCQRAQKLSRAH